MSVAEAFEPLRSALDQAGVRFAVGGSWASTAHGDARFTQDIDIVADFSEPTLRAFLSSLPPEYRIDVESSIQAIRSGQSFNIVYSPTVMKFDFFPAGAFALGSKELDRAIPLAVTALSRTPVPFVTPEDIILAKLHWFRRGGEVSAVQLRDVEAIVRLAEDKLDREYLQSSAAEIGVTDLLQRLFKKP